MAATQIKLFYDPATLALNRAVICDGDDETDANLNAHLAGPGEGYCYMLRSNISQNYNSQELLDAAAFAISAQQ